MNLVTGATGLLGSHIVEQLRLRDEPVRVLVRHGSDTDWLERQNVEFVHGDLSNHTSLSRACRGARIVYHAAARVGDWGPWKDFVKVTIEGTRNLAEAAAAARCERFLHISSISAYGHPDGEGLVLDETAPLGQDLHHLRQSTQLQLTLRHQHTSELVLERPLCYHYQHPERANLRIPGD